MEFCWDGVLCFVFYDDDVLNIGGRGVFGDVGKVGYFFFEGGLGEGVGEVDVYFGGGG